MSRIQVYTRTNIATGKVYGGIPEYRHQTENLGQTSLHSEPQIGHALIFNNQTYRIEDVAHPTENESGKGIFLPKVLVRVEDIPWLDGVA